ncbi:hypothetical protein [Aquimarina algiphila]|uniref:DUF3078 domain-containing protein n=1 Tax=Aquimarina algiphila TaxID=2047982 RepID=A0A554VCF7_9FLAO|nr:hypothetical protein [Aquimarina algiphila]TSE04383.1 hypothetical protein FOF46_26520 [Aquimarina algiphila]
MLLSKALASSHLLVLCFALCTYTTIHSQRKKDLPPPLKWVNVTSINKEYFRVKNTLPIRIGVYISSPERTIYFMPYEEIMFSTNYLINRPIFRLKYSDEALSYQERIYEREFNQLQKDLEEVGDWADIVDEVSKRLASQDRNINNNKENNAPTTGDALEVLGVVKAVEIVANLEKKYRIIREMNLASNGANNRFKAYFQKVNLREIVLNQRNNFQEINRKNLVYVGATVWKNRLGDNWRSKGRSRVPDLLYGRRLSKGFKIGGKTYISPYAFVRLDQNTYNMDNSDKTFFLSSSYVGGGDGREFSEIVSEEDIALQMTQASSGLLVRMNVLGRYTFDVGAGYNFFETNLLRFNDVDHLSNGSVREDSYKDTVDYNATPIYGMFRLGVDINRGAKFGLGEVYVLTQFWQSDLMPNDGYQIFQTANQADKLPITDGKQFLYTINVGLAFNF